MKDYIEYQSRDYKNAVQRAKDMEHLIAKSNKDNFKENQNAESNREWFYKQIFMELGIPLMN